MNSILILIVLSFSLHSFSFSKVVKNPTALCNEEAVLYIDQEYAAEICQNAKAGFQDCAQVTKNDINQAPVMSDNQLIRCAKALPGFKDCYPIASNSLDKEYSLDLCSSAKEGFKTCAVEEMKQVGYPILTDSQIQSCLGK
ncbi:MAG: hypothetical protein AB8E15_11880 [Bdellovibrionales bacterium]